MNTCFVLLSLAVMLSAVVYALLHGGGVNEEIKAGREQVLDDLAASLMRNKREDELRAQMRNAMRFW